MTKGTEKTLSGIWMEHDLLGEELGSNLLEEEGEEGEAEGVVEDDETMVVVGEIMDEITADREGLHHRATPAGNVVMEVAVVDVEESIV